MTPLALRLAACHKKLFRLKARRRDSAPSYEERQLLTSLLASEMTTFLKLLILQVEAISPPQPRAPDKPSSPS